jgi:hypothetical protein
MQLITCNDWTDETIGESEYKFAQTSDPRVLAVLQYDPHAQISELYDGDAINPIIYVDHAHGLSFSWVAGYDDGTAEKMQAAYDRWGWGDATARRYLWIFHGIAAENANGGYDRSGNWIVATSREYLEHIGNEPVATYDEAREDCLSIAKDLEDALDGYVYGIGHATLEERRLHDDEEINLSEWSIEIQSWGYVGEEYAKREAADQVGYEVELPEMIEVPA